MGSGTSVPQQLSSADKELIGKKLLEFDREKFANGEINAAEVFDEFMKVVEQEKARNSASPTGDPVLNSVASGMTVPCPNVKPSSMASTGEFDYEQIDADEFSEEEVEDGETPARMRLNTHFREENAFIRGRTSSQMLDEATTTMDENAGRIASFIADLKKGDVRQSKIEGGIRIRRLTSGTTIQEDHKAISPPISKRKSGSSVPRTTIFASTEIGVRQERSAPFEPEIMGTFSCHGFEPSDDTEDGIQQKINQDRGCVVYPFNARNSDALFMALDGHGEEGDRVAEFTMRQIVITLEKHPKLLTDPTNALKESFVTTNTALMLTPIKFMTSGSTVVAVYVTGNTFYIANVGDSRAVLAVSSEDDNTGLQACPLSPAPAGGSSSHVDKCKAQMLSRDHKPDDPEEERRITQWGGFVQPSPEPGITARVWLDKEFTHIGLAMSRSIGDHAVKNVGVIPEPDVFTHDLCKNDKFLILASDGVWEFIENQEAVDIVQANLHLGAFVACQILIQTAAQRWSEEEGDYRDDITAIVVTLPLPFQTLA